MKTKIEWVFLLLETEHQEMIFVEENNENNRPWKKQGQYFFPAGTKELWEPLQKTIHREFQEETGLNWSTTIVEETLLKIGQLFLETEEFSLIAHVYTGTIPWDTKIKTNKFNSHEINSIKVVHPTVMLNEDIEKLRPWLIEALLLKQGIHSDNIHIENGLYKDIWEANKRKEELQLLYNI